MTTHSKNIAVAQNVCSSLQSAFKKELQCFNYHFFFNQKDQSPYFSPFLLITHGAHRPLTTITKPTHPQMMRLYLLMNEMQGSRLHRGLGNHLRFGVILVKSPQMVSIWQVQMQDLILAYKMRKSRESTSAMSKSQMDPRCPRDVSPYPSYRSGSSRPGLLGRSEPCR